MIVYGGMSSVGTIYGDGSRYDPATDTWSLVSPTGSPGQRWAHVVVWTGKEMLVWGGRGDASGGRYDPASDSWDPTTLLAAPLVRGGGRWSTVWTGSQMIIWGGVIETQQGSLYCALGTPNAAPVATNDGYSVARGATLVVGPESGVLANDTDDNGDALTASLLPTTAHGMAKTLQGSLQFNANGPFTYTPNPATRASTASGIGRTTGC
jgi:hypothetical protein